MHLDFSPHTSRAWPLSHSSPHAPFPSQAPAILSCAGKGWRGPPSKRSSSSDAQGQHGHHVLPMPTSCGGEQQQTWCPHLHKLECVAQGRTGLLAITTSPSLSSPLTHSSCEHHAFSAPPKYINVTTLQLLATWLQSHAPIPAGMQAVQAGMKWNPWPFWRVRCCCDTSNTTCLSILGYHSCEWWTCVRWSLAPFCASAKEKRRGRERSDTSPLHLMKAKSDGGRGGETDWALSPLLINACFEKRNASVHWFLLVSRSFCDLNNSCLCKLLIILSSCFVQILSTAFNWD